MPAVASQWSVVVVGHWNRAILTPSGIGRRVFGIAVGQAVPLEVLVPIDEYGPYQVKYQGTTVIAGSDRLVLQCNSPNFESLARAKTMAARAIGELPHTPFLAVGLNVGFECEPTEKNLPALNAHPEEVKLSDAGFEILDRSLRRSVRWGTGKLNISISQEHEEPTCKVALNFDLKSKVEADLTRWLNTEIVAFRESTEKVLNEYLGLEAGEIRYANE